MKYLDPKLILFLLLFTGCTLNNKSKYESNSSTVPVVVDLLNVKKTNTSLKLSAFAENISYIQLDEDPLLGDMKLATIHVVNDTIYIDRENIYKYTPEGKFIKKLFRVGQGPKEVKKHISVPAAINRSERFFTIKNAFGLNYKSYSFDGEYIGEESVMDSLVKRINIYVDNCQVFEYTSSRNGYFKVGEKMNIIGPNMFYVKDLGTNEIRFKLSNPAADELATFTRQMEWSGGNMHFIQIDTLLWFKHPAIDTLYYTKDFKTVNPGYIFKTDNSFMDMRKYIHYKVGDITKDKAMNTHSVIEAIPLPHRGLLFFLEDGRMGITAANRQTFIYNEKPIINDLDTHLPEIDYFNIFYAQHFSIEKGYLYFLIDAYKFFEGNAISPLSFLTEDSNPVVVRVKLK